MNGRRKFTNAAILVAHVLLATVATAQETELRIDLVFESRISEVLAGLQSDEANFDHIRAFAVESFKYYQQHPSTVTGEKAAAAAFKIWGNLGAVDEVQKAMAFLPKDSAIWSKIMTDMGSAYFKEGGEDVLFEFLLGLETELTHPEAQSEALLSLGRLFLRRQQNDEAVTRFKQIIALDGDWFRVGLAKGYLNEFENLAIGQVAPEFTATTLSGDSLSLSDLRGGPVLLEFWATWCAPCIPEIPRLKKLHNDYARDGLQIVGVSFDTNLTGLRQFIADEAMPWVQLPAELQGPLALLFNVQGVPRSLLLDHQGRIVAKDVVGENLEAAVVEVIKGNF